MTRRRFFQAFAALMVTVCLLALSGVLSAQGNRDNAFERVKEVQERHTEALMAREGVVGTAVGLDDDENPAVMVLLEHGAVAGIPAQVDGVKVKKMVTGEIRAFDDTARYDRPVPIGVSTGHFNITAGTIACRVKDPAGNVYALSNNHVYADENLAKIGDNVLQPGRYDGGVNPVDAIGTLYAFEPISFTSNNTIDAAIALTTENQVGTATPADGYGTPRSTPVKPTLRMRVQKRGRTTGLTTGKIAGLNATVRVGYDGGVAQFVGQIVISPGTFSAGGDSGSLIVTQADNSPVGLLFAGSSTATIANPIGPVLDRFGVTIDDGSGGGGTVNTPPVVEITSPSDGSTFASGTAINLAGTATDAEDGDLASALLWTSDRDGSIGTGGSLSRVLSDGVHTITASVADSDGANASDSISVTVTTGTPAGELCATIAGITFRAPRAAGKNTFVIADAVVEVRAGGNLVSGATVTGVWSGAVGSTSTGTTGQDGRVTLTSAEAKVKSGSTFTLRITDAALPGYTFSTTCGIPELSATWP